MSEGKLTLEMTITRTEFLRRLPEAVDGPFQQDGDAFQGGRGAATWQIRIAPLTGARLGPVVLDRLKVELEFDGYTAGEQEAFLARFRLHFHRGGG